MAIAASSVTPTNSLEDFRIEFNNLVSDVTGITATNKFDSDIIFEGATADAYETTLTVTDPTADRTITVPNATGTITLDGNPASADGAALGTTALEWSDLYLADGGTIYFGADQDINLSHTADWGLTVNGNLAVQGILLPQPANGYALGGAAYEWADLYLADAGVIYFGNDQDVTLTHNADTGLTLNLMMAATTFEPTGDTASGDNAAIGYTSAEGLILTGQGSTNDVTIKNDADGDVITIATGTTNVTIAGDLTISGDDLFMGTNTSAYILVADGTNYNPVAVSGDVTISNAGAITIASTAVEGSMLNNNVISGLTALTSGLATTDEVMISDAGTLKRMDVSLITALSTGDATALAIALG